jgi:preprotein translocase subunit SecD
MPAQHVTAARPDPFAALHVPADEDAYSRLTPAQQTQLVNALRGVDCAHPPVLPKTDLRVVCDAYSYAYLLGPTIFTGHDVRSATPIAPTVNGVTPQWRIALSLSTSGGDRMWDWTSQHHTDFPDGVYTVTQESAKVPCGETVKTPCADFLAYVSDDLVVSVPVISDPFRTAVLLSGDFTKASATRLAHKMAG